MTKPQQPVQSHSPSIRSSFLNPDDGGPSFYYADPRTFAIRKSVRANPDKGDRFRPLAPRCGYIAGAATVTAVCPATPSHSSYDRQNSVWQKYSRLC
jgi:hypothetical protein